MEKYWIPFFGVDKITSDLYVMDANSMSLISKRATTMPQVSTSTGVGSQCPSQVLSPPSGADSSFTLLAAESTQVPQGDRMVIGNEERCAIGGTPLSITSCSSSASSGLANIDLTKEMLDEASKEKLTGKIMGIKDKLKKKRKFHGTILANYKDETIQNIEEIRYRMHLYWYKPKIWQCEILLAYTGSLKALKTIPPSLASYVEPTVGPTPCSISQVPFQGTGEVSWPSTPKWDAARIDVLATLQKVTQLFPPTSGTNSGFISLMDSNDTSVAGAQGESSSIMTKKKQVGNIKLVPRSVVNNTQELRMTLPNQICSPSPMWSHHLNWMMIYLPHKSYHLFNLIVFNPSWGWVT